MDITVKINDKEYLGTQGETILELCNRNNINIPTLCHDPRLLPYSSCFVCVVEIEGMRGLQASCSTKIQDGQVIITDNERVRKSRKAALDLLVSNHYADCVGPCKISCPAGVDVQGYMSLIEKKMYREAVELIKEVNPLPAICGRVCVRPCEVSCRRNLLDEGNPAGIDYLKRFVADKDLKSGNKFAPKIAPSTGKYVAVIGAGPAGLSTAYFLQQKGHQVDIFESNPSGGGMLRYGIPEYRLPNDVLQQEIDNITDIGVNIYYKQKLGDNLNFSELNDKYDSIVLTIGSQKGTLVGCEGDDAVNVFSGIDFLRNMEMTGQRYNFAGKTVAVVGGGNTAMDCCRTSIRCNADKVYIIYRRTEKEMPANPIEIHESKLEGVEYLFLTNPSKINKDEKGVLQSMTCLKMELGEPDASGRRRPVPIKGSEFELELDYVLAAIGQKTDVNFVDKLNEISPDEKLILNRWGNIDADKHTLQTGIKKIFAAGDSVTGAATIIQAIAQANIVARSCHQYLSDLAIEPIQDEFLSKKDNFKKQLIKDYKGDFVAQKREEMPILEPAKRKNFKEVELGYSEKAALHEADRCLECGCVVYYDCDLKNLATEYSAEQNKFSGEFVDKPVDFSHPYIEINNNKCILCSRCIRICHEVVGANALGLVNRGFDTYVAPSLEESLIDTNCESCGLCISACPTGAITENLPFKPGPLKLSEFDTISNYGSIGERITIHHKNGFVMKVTGAMGLVNKDGNIGRYDKFGFSYFNDRSRIKKPMLRVDGKLKEISFDEAYKVIKDRIDGAKPDENAFFAGARLTNEEIYLIQKLARVGAKTNNVSSFHYADRGDGYLNNTIANTPFEQIGGASKIFVIGCEINREHPVVSFMVNNARVVKNVPIELIATYEDGLMAEKVDSHINVTFYYGFIKAVNHYLLSNNLENKLFIDDNCSGFDKYKKTALDEDFDMLVKSAGVDKKDIIKFANDFNNQINAIIIFSEHEISSAESIELFNLVLITGKLGKTSSGIIALKEKNNSQGLIDMGAFPHIGTGNQSITDKTFVSLLKEKLQCPDLPTSHDPLLFDALLDGHIKNTFIFGEDPIGCLVPEDEPLDVLGKTEFVVVQDYFLTETAEMADLILPASFPSESGGSFTNTQKIIQTFEPGLKSKVEKLNHEQLIDLLKLFGSDGIYDINDIMNEIVSILPFETEKPKSLFQNTEEDDYNLMFDYGCDNLILRFDDEFEERMMGY